MSARPEVRAVVPAITTWTRLEPQPRDASMRRSLQAQIRDPLWMLARQWQVGEFAGDDAGSPVQATLGIESQTFTGYRPGPPGGAAVAFDQGLPLEIHVEREAAMFKVRGAVQLGLLFEARITASLSSAQSVIDAFRAAFPIAAADPDPALAGDVGLALRGLAAGRVTDGEALYRSALIAQGGGVPDPPLPPEASDPDVAPVLAAFLTFRQSAFSEPAADAAWQDSELAYSFAVEAACTDPNSSVVLESGAFPGGHLDWYSFDQGDESTVTAPQAPAFASANRLPLHVTFRGMPEDRWWDFEDSVTDFGQLDAEHVDLAKLLVMEFALVYGTDWFYLPVPGQFGSLQRVTTLVVTDTFGERTLIRPVEQYPVGGSVRPWSMFKISSRSGGAVSDYLVLAPTLGLSDDAEPVEDVLFLRDNVAALAWAVEQQLQSAADDPVDGYECYLARIRADPSVTPPAPDPTGAGVAYTLEQAPPDNWIPFVPVLSTSGELLLRRGTMDIPGPGGSVIQLKPHSEILEPSKPYYLTDRVLTPVGVDVRRYLRRTRSPDGSTLVWMARQSGPGRGPGSSGLKFDFLRAVASDASRT